MECAKEILNSGKPITENSNNLGDDWVGELATIAESMFQTFNNYVNKVDKMWDGSISDF